MIYEHLGHNRLSTVILGRNEGKLKSYASCIDTRAWSHDCGVRDRYLKEWMKCNMPVCIMSVGNLIRLLSIMTIQRTGRNVPRCHPNCKARALLDDVCVSCKVMRNCLTKNEKFEKYFEEEEFETSQWPCETLLDALKNIKMFWKIIVEKLLNIKIPKNEPVLKSYYSKINSIRSIANIWRNDIIHEAKIVENALVGNQSDVKNEKINSKTESSIFSLSKYADMNSKVVLNSSLESITDCMFCEKTRQKQKIDNCTSTQIETADACCSSRNVKRENESRANTKNNSKCLQRKCIIKNEDFDRLRKENQVLKLELQKAYNNLSRTPALRFKPAGFDSIPKPFESCIEEYDADEQPKTKSEVLITIKKIKNENFKNVSLLQVLHKTNGPATFGELSTDAVCCKNEDSVEFLSKVQNAFGAIVRKEMYIASNKSRIKNSEVRTTFKNVNQKRPSHGASFTQYNTPRKGKVQIKAEPR